MYENYPEQPIFCPYCRLTPEGRPPFQPPTGPPEGRPPQPGERPPAGRPPQPGERPPVGRPPRPGERPPVGRPPQPGERPPAGRPPQPGGRPPVGRPPSGPPQGPPPSFTPPLTQAQQLGGPIGPGGPSAFAVDTRAIRGCLYRYTFIWLRGGRGFWAYLTFVGRRSIAGWRWNGRFWVYFGIDARRIQGFYCY